MAKKNLDNINKVTTTTIATPPKSRTNQTTKFLTGFKPKPRFKTTPVEDSDPTELKLKRVDLIQLSITIALAIIALWSAYFVTRLLSTDAAPFASITKTVDQIKDKLAKPDTTTKTNQTETSQKSTNGTATTSTTDTNSTTNPFAPDTTTPDTASTPTAAAVTIAKDSFNIRLLNGNGTPGDASKYKASLTSQGFKVGTIGNARLKYDKTQIYYVAGQESQANLVKDALSGRQIEVSQQNQDLVGSGYQVLVVLGRS